MSSCLWGGGGGGGGEGAAQVKPGQRAHLLNRLLVLLLGERMGEGAAGVGGTAVAAVARESTEPAALKAGDPPASTRAWPGSASEPELGIRDAPSRKGMDALQTSTTDSAEPLDVGMLVSAGLLAVGTGWQMLRSRLYVWIACTDAPPNEACNLSRGQEQGFQHCHMGSSSLKYLVQ